MPTFSSILSFPDDGSSLASGGGFWAHPCAKTGRQKAESRKQKTEGSRRKAEGSRRKTDFRKNERPPFCLLPSAFCFLPSAFWSFISVPQVLSRAITSWRPRLECELHRSSDRPNRSYSVLRSLRRALASSPEADDLP